MIYYLINILFVLPSVIVGVCVGRGGFTGWQPMSSTSLQQSSELWQMWSQKHPLLLQDGDKAHKQHPE